MEPTVEPARESEAGIGPSGAEEQDPAELVSELAGALAAAALEGRSAGEGDEGREVAEHRPDESPAPVARGLTDVDAGVAMSMIEAGLDTDEISAFGELKDAVRTPADIEALDELLSAPQPELSPGGADPATLMAGPPPKAQAPEETREDAGLSRRPALRGLPHRGQLEAAFGEALGDVRVIQGQDAEPLLEGAGAKAFAFGDLLVLPASASLELVAHEVAHVLQLRGAGVEAGSLPHQTSRPNDPAEREAQDAGERARLGQPIQLQETPRAALSREADQGGLPSYKDQYEFMQKYLPEPYVDAANIGQDFVPGLKNLEAAWTGKDPIDGKPLSAWQRVNAGMSVIMPQAAILHGLDKHGESISKWTSSKSAQLFGKDNLDAWDTGLGFVPFVSNALDITKAVTGYNPITGEKAGPFERLAAAGFAIPGIGNVLKFAGKGLKFGGKFGLKAGQWLSKGDGLIAKGMRNIGDKASGLWDNTKNSVAGGTDWLMRKGRQLKEGTLETLGRIKDKASGTLHGVWDKVQRGGDWLRSGLSGIKDRVASLPGSAHKAWKGLGERFQGALKWGKEQALGLKDTVTQSRPAKWIGDRFQDIKQLGQSGFSRAKDLVESTSIGRWGMRKFSEASGWVKEGVEGIRTSGGRLYKGATEWLGEQGNKLKAKGFALRDNLYRRGTAAKDYLGGKVGPLVDKAKHGMNWVGAKASGYAQAAWNKVTSTTKKVTDWARERGGTWLKDHLIESAKGWADSQIAVWQDQNIAAPAGEAFKKHVGPWWEKQKQSAAEVAHKIHGKAVEGVSYAKERLVAGQKWLGERWNSGSELVSKTWSDTKDAASSTWKSIKTTVPDTLQSLKGTAAQGWQNVQSSAKEAWKNKDLVGGIKSVGTHIGSTVKQAGQDVAKGWSSVTAPAKKLVNKVGSAFSKWF
jgi:hypothetical protein